MTTFRKYIILVLASFLLFGFMSCEDTNEPIVFEQDDAYIAFTSTSKTIKEGASATTYAIPVMVVATEGSPEVTVDFEFVPDTANSPAYEGQNYELVNDSKTLTFSKGWGYDTIFVKTIPDGEFTGDKSFFVDIVDNSQGYQDNGPESTINVTWQDNEHPLNLILGTYEITGMTGFDPPESFTRTVEIKPHPENYTQVAIQVNQFSPGWGFPDDEIFYADVDMDEITFKIQAGQSFGDYGYGPSKIIGYVGDAGDPLIADGEYITGDIAEDGTITLNDWIGVTITSGSNEGVPFDLYQPTTWTKVGKKSGDIETNYDEQREPKRFNQ